MTAKVAVIYYSATGTVHTLAQAVAEGATSAGAEVRLRRVAELAPDSAIDANPLWRAHADATSAIAEASIEDLAWADAFAFGTPSARYCHDIDAAEDRPPDHPLTCCTRESPLRGYRAPSDAGVGGGR